MSEVDDQSDKVAGDSIFLNNEQEVLQILTESVQGLWEAVNNLTPLRPTRRLQFRVTIFGSARVPREHWIYATVRDLAKELAAHGLWYRHWRRAGTDAGGQ